MENLLGVDVLQRDEHLDEDSENVFLLEQRLLLLLQEVEQSPALHVLHHDHQSFVLEEILVIFHDVRMLRGGKRTEEEEEKERESKKEGITFCQQQCKLPTRIPAKPHPPLELSHLTCIISSPPPFFSRRQSIFSRSYLQHLENLDLVKGGLTFLDRHHFYWNLFDYDMPAIRHALAQAYGSVSAAPNRPQFYVLILHDHKMD